MRRFQTLFTILVLAAAGTALAELPASILLRPEVNPREIHIGDVVDYKLTVVYSETVTMLPFNFSGALGSFEVLRSAVTPPRKTSDNKLMVQCEMAITTFSTGTQIVPALALKFKTAEGQEAEAKTESFSIKVKSLLEEKGDIGNLLPPKGFFNFKSWFWLWVTLAVIVVTVGTYFLISWWQTKRQIAEALKPARPAEETAWEALQKLEISDLIAKGQIKEFYYQLSVIFRQYLESRYQISALERTTAELLMELRRMNFTLELTSLSRDFLDNGDLVKFAKFTPSAEEIIMDVNRVKQFLQLTTPQAQPASPPTQETIPV